jgi:hypothetical protein
MKSEAEDTGHYEAIAAISAAEDAAKNGDQTTTLAKLRAAGSWALDVATKIGVSIASEALKKAIGLG